MARTKQPPGPPPAAKPKPKPKPKSKSKKKATTTATAPKAKAPAAASTSRRRHRDDEDDEQEHARRRRGEESSDAPDASDASASSSSSDEEGGGEGGAGGGGRKGAVAFGWAKPKGARGRLQGARGRTRRGASSDDEDEEEDGSGSGRSSSDSGSEEEEEEEDSNASAPAPRRRGRRGPAPASSSRSKKGKGKGTGPGRGRRKQVVDDDVGSDGDDESEAAMSVRDGGSDSDEEAAAVAAAKPPRAAARGRKGKGPPSLDSEEEDEPATVVLAPPKKGKRKATAAAAAGGKGKRKAVKAAAGAGGGGKAKKKGKKTKIKAEPAMHQIFGNSELFHHLLLQPGFIERAADVVRLGSTCKAFSELRAPPTEVEMDMKEAAVRFKFPNRFLASLARPGNKLESISITNAFSGEMCRNLGNVLSSGQLPHLEELTLIQGCDDIGDTFTKLITADLPSFGFLTLKHCKILADHWKKLEKQLKKDQELAPHKRTLTMTKKKKPVNRDGGCLLHLRSLTLVDQRIPPPVLAAWIEALAFFDAPLQHLELEASLPRWGIHRIFAPIKESCFPELQELIVDDGELSEKEAVSIIRACGAGVRALRTLSLSNRQAGRWYGGQNGAWQIIDALRDEAADADSGLQALEYLAIGWRGISDEALNGLLELVFGEAPDAETGPATKTKKKSARPAFPNLMAFGLIKMNAHLTINTAKWVVERALARGIIEVDFSFNAFPATDVVELIETASDHVHAAAAANPGQSIELFLQARQFTRRFKNRYRLVTEWMVQRRELRRHVDSVLRGLASGSIADGLEVDIGEAEMHKRNA